MFATILSLFWRLERDSFKCNYMRQFKLTIKLKK